MKIELKHGAGGQATGKLIQDCFAKYFNNELLNKMEDGAVLPKMQGYPVFTSDSFGVEPLFFPGGDIGRLAVCGTVNDLAAMGAKTLYLTASFILETGLDMEILEQIVASMGATAKEAGVVIVAGDTKVIEGRGGCYINTAGIGERQERIVISAHNLQAGDGIIVTGTLGDHHATVLTSRMGMESRVRSDCAPLNKIVGALLEGGIVVHAMRDITTVANELAESSGVKILLQEEMLPVNPAVQGLCGILGLDPLTMGNEGKLCIVLPADQAERALKIIREQKYGNDAVLVGRVEQGEGVWLQNELGGCRRIQPLQGEGLPRIC